MKLITALGRTVRRGRLAPSTRQLVIDDMRGFVGDLVASDGPTERPVEGDLVRCAFDIDAVYTWVDAGDPGWSAALEAAAASSGTAIPADLDARFGDHDELRFSLRSLDRYADWFRHVFIVTAGQRPSWLLDHPKITLVDHGDLLPATALPTFNSHAIEASLHRIDQLAEHFVYFNDDVFLGRHVSPSTFFDPTTGRPRFAVGTAPPPDRARDVPGQYAAGWRTQHLVQSLTPGVVTTLLHHAPYPQRRSILLELEEEHPELFEATRHHRFRHPDDISVPASLAPWWAIVTERGEVGTGEVEYVSVGHATTNMRLRRLTRMRRHDSFCLNWTELTSPHWERRIGSFLADRFPDVPAWECSTCP